MCLFAEQVFRSTYFCCWKHIAVDSEFFVLSTLEKYHQISFSGPWYLGPLVDETFKDGLRCAF